MATERLTEFQKDALYCMYHELPVIMYERTEVSLVKRGLIEVLSFLKWRLTPAGVEAASTLYYGTAARKGE